MLNINIHKHLIYSFRQFITSPSVQLDEKLLDFYNSYINIVDSNDPNKTLKIIKRHLEDRHEVVVLESLKNLLCLVNPVCLDKKGYSKCIVFKKDDIEKCETILHNIDEFEYEYIPKQWITDIAMYRCTDFHGKFEPNLQKFYAECEKQNILLLVISEPQNKEFYFGFIEDIGSTLYNDV